MPIRNDADLGARPIPLPIDPATALDYHRVPIDRTDPRHGEPLVPAAWFGLAGQSFYARQDGLNAPYGRPLPDAPAEVWCRESVARALAAVNRRLRPVGVELFLLDGWRPIALQRGLWAHFVAAGRERLAGGESGADPSPADLIAFAGRYCSNPDRFAEDDPTTWPVHCTGGAVDLTLRRLGSGGELLFMGGVFDDPSPISHTRFFEAPLPPPLDADSVSAAVARRHRRLLYHAMTEEGFANYAYEWWHYDLGTQLWALGRAAHGTAPRAWYGLPPRPA